MKTILQIILLITLHSNCIINAVICALILSISIKPKTIMSNPNGHSQGSPALPCTLRAHTIYRIWLKTHIFPSFTPQFSRNVWQRIRQCITFTPLGGTPQYQIFLHIRPPYGGTMTCMLHFFLTWGRHCSNFSCFIALSRGSVCRLQILKNIQNSYLIQVKILH